MQFEEALYLLLVRLKTFNRIALCHAHTLHKMYVKNDDTTRKILDGTYIFGNCNYYSLNHILCKAK